MATSKLKHRKAKQQKIKSSSKKEDSIEHRDTAENNKKAIISLTLSQTVQVLTLIFGGCCSNVLTLEKIVKEYPDSGHLVTFVQFLLVSFEGLFYFYDPTSLYLLKKPKIPLSRWILPVFLYFTISILNNAVWAFNVSIPIHIIFRSAGTVTTMLTGWLFMNKKYTKKQISAVLVLTAGCIMATSSASNTDGNNNNNKQTVDWKFVQGIGILTLAAAMSSFQGLVGEQTYAKYGRHWRENLFYTHFFSLILFIPILPQMKSEFIQMQSTGTQFMLALNALTQYVCVRGVNKLAGHSSALTVVIILNIRKFVSLVLSSVLFGNTLDFQGMIGAAFVFIGALLYSYN